MSDVFELLVLAGMSLAYYVLVIAPYRKVAAAQRDAPIAERILVIARRLVFVALYSTALVFALQRLAPLNLIGAGKTIAIAAAVIAAIEILWGPQGEAEWAAAMRTGLTVCKITLLGVVLALTLSGGYALFTHAG